MSVRLATMADIPAIKKIADVHRDEIGFVMRPTLEAAITKDWLLVAEQEQKTLGFCNFRHCQRPIGRTTIYEIAVSTPMTGVGRLLITTLIQDVVRCNQMYIYLKCVQGLEANAFYKKMGFTLAGTEAGKKRALNIWRLDINTCWI